MHYDNDRVGHGVMLAGTGSQTESARRFRAEVHRLAIGLWQPIGDRFGGG